MKTLGEALSKLIDDRPIKIRIREDKKHLSKSIEEVFIALISMQLRKTALA